MKRLKLIGKGLFSKVYRLNDKQVFISSVCYVKECLSFDWHNSKGIFPVYKRQDYNEYVCEYYPPVKSLKNALSPQHYEIYKNLRSLDIGYVENPYDFLDAWRDQFKNIKNKKFRNALLDLTDHLSNYGTQLRFEISPRNVAVKNGKLILLDVFFFHNQRESQTSLKSKRYAY